MTTGRVAAFYGAGQPMQIKEYPVPDPEPGAIVVKMTVANVCGSDLHQWRGEFDVEKFGRPYPQILGHEMTGTVHALGDGVTRDTAGLPLVVGDLVRRGPALLWGLRRLLLRAAGRGAVQGA